MSRIPDKDLIAAYQETGSVWRTGVRFNLCGQSVHERLIKLGAIKQMRVLSEDEKWLIRSLYSKGFQTGDGQLKALSKAINRTVSFICRFANSEGLTTQRATTQEKKQERTLKILKSRFANTGSTAGHRFKTTWKAAWREIAGQRIFFRSRWEFNYALYLQFLLEHKQISKWEHEPEVFWFEGVKRGTVSYLPDFRVTLIGGSVEYHEVKGWMDPRSKTKIRRMAKYHPKIVLRVLDSNWFGVNAPTLSKLLTGWESMKRPAVKPHTPEML